MSFKILKCLEDFAAAKNYL